MKHKPKTLLIIAAVAVMLAAATNASAYYEAWDGWFNSGYLTYSGIEICVYFEYVEGEGVLEDLTDGSIDEFFVSAVTLSTFTCSTPGDYFGYYIKLWPGASGWKYTGQSGTKEAYDGEWSGTAILYGPYQQPIQTFDVWGTWDTTSEPGDCFNYLPGKQPNYSAHWEISDSDPDGLDGEGGSEGELIRSED